MGKRDVSVVRQARCVTKFVGDLRDRGDLCFDRVGKKRPQLTPLRPTVAPVLGPVRYKPEIPLGRKAHGPVWLVREPLNFRFRLLKPD